MEDKRKMKNILLISVIILTFYGLSVQAQTTVSEADKTAIKQTALDYIEGWYNGDAERMERALHPDLAKRIVRVSADNKFNRLDQMSAMSLVQGTRRGGGPDPRSPPVRRSPRARSPPPYAPPSTPPVPAWRNGRRRGGSAFAL